MPLLVPSGLTVLHDRAVRFRLASDAHTVRLAADFTRWSGSPLTLHRTEAGNEWEVVTSPLADGVHFYKYIVDGHWIHDPSHPLVEPDGCGGWNSVFGLGGPPLGNPEHLRVASLNLRTYQEPEPLLKLEQIAYTLAAMDVDLIALQEVGEHLNDGGRPNAGEVIRNRLQALTGRSWEHVWRMAHLGFEVYREGVSLLVPGSLFDVREYRLSQGRLARNALAGTVTSKGVALRLISTHLTWGAGGGLREAQSLVDSLRAEGTNGVAGTLIAGDLNANEDEPQIELLREEGFVDVAREFGQANGTFLTALPQMWQGFTSAAGFVLTSRIDYQMLRPGPGRTTLRPVGCVPIFNGLVVGDLYQPRVSDHVGVLGIYEVQQG